MSVSDFLDERIGASDIGADGATVARLRQAMDSGSLTSAGLTAFYLDRIERLNPPVARGDLGHPRRARAGDGQ